MTASQTKRTRVVLAAIFFVSGFPALLYQLVWQRSLFQIYGINIESVSVVVTAFMLGLGLGSLAGGKISERPKVPLLVVFAGIELGIALYGYLSLDLFAWVGSLTAGGGAAQTGLLAFVLVVAPTMGMGATLPLLVAYFVRHTGNVGRSVGLLYFVNTIGSACACFAAAWYLMKHLGMSGTLLVAVCTNIAVAVSALMAARLARPPGAQDTPDEPAGEADSGAGAGGEAPRFGASLVLVALAGFVSLSYEILWVRVYSFTTGGMAAAFAMVLGSFLLGIALGSLGSRRFCPTRVDDRQLKVLALFVVAANAAGFLVVPAVAHMVVEVTFYWTLVAVVIAAGLLGALFPLLSHFGVPPDERAGARVSYLYLSSIVGSSLGSFLTGFVLLDVWSMQTINVFLALFGLVMALGIMALVDRSPKVLGRWVAAALVAAVCVVASSGPLFDKLWERLQIKKGYNSTKQFAHIVESKSGVITVSKHGTIYGGGIYDGRFSTSLVKDRNAIIRPFAISALHPKPAKMMVIGLSSGSWVQVLANHPDLESMTVVEIDEGYIELIRKYPAVRSLLDHPKVEIVIDDGRRWLRAHPDDKFDVIVMNTSFSTRAFASNLLSVQFLELARSRLLEGGLLLYNTTSMENVYKTGLSVFAHGVRVKNNLAVSDQPFQVSAERWRDVLTRYRIDGKPVFDLQRPGHRKRLAKVVSTLKGLKRKNARKATMERGDAIARRVAKRRIITDDNMGNEWNNLGALRVHTKHSR